MLSFFRRKPVAELVYFDEGIVHFRCSSTLARGQVVKVLCRLPEGEEFDARLKVRSETSREGLYMGLVEYPSESQQFLSVLLPTPQDQRAVPRMDQAVRAVSRQFQGYHAMTTNLSVDGVCLLTESPYAPGTTLELGLDLDAPGVRGISARVEVRWCLPQPGTRKFRIGGRFIDLPEEHGQTIQRFLDHMHQRRTTGPG